MIHPRAASLLLVLSIVATAGLSIIPLLFNVVVLVLVTLFTSARRLCILFHLTTVVPMAAGLSIIHASQLGSFVDAFQDAGFLRPVVQFSSVGTALQLFIYPYYHNNLLPLAVSSVGLRGAALNFISASVNGIEDLLRASKTMLDALRSRSLIESTKARITEFTSIAGSVTAYALRSAILRESVCDHRGIDSRLVIGLENGYGWSAKRTYLAMAGAGILAIADYWMMLSRSVA